MQPILEQMKRSATVLITFLLGISAFAQSDTLFNRTMDEIVVTATRTERKIGNVAVPVSSINKKTIQLSGSLRLNDILQEQTGLQITGGTGSNAVGGGVFGNGVKKAKNFSSSQIFHDFALPSTISSKIVLCITLFSS